MQDLFLDLSEIGNGVIAFDQETYMISKFDGSVKSCFKRFNQLGNELYNYLTNTAKIQTNVSFENRSSWFDPKGVSCSILSPETNGWQSGRVKIKLQVIVEFYPDNPGSFMEIPEEEREPLSEAGSPLDDLRSMEER